MKIGKRGWLLLGAAPIFACLLTSCGDFWQAPSTSSTTGFSLSASPTSITVAQGGTSSTVTLTVTPGSSFTGTVTLSCPVTSAATGATSATDPTCTFSSSSLTFSSATAQQPTLTVSAASDTPLGSYTMTLTGTSGSTAETTPLCVEVGTGTCTAASTSSGYFYILNSGGPGQIAGFSISSSALASVGSTQSVSGATAVAIAPSGENFLYVASTSSGITLYTITNGALQTGVNFNGDIQAAALAVDPSGTWLLDASGVGTLTAYPITSAGALDTSRQAQTPLNLDSLAIEHGSITISPNGAIGAVALGTTGTQIFSFSSGTLADCNKLITPTYKSAGAALSVAIDPQNRYLYIGETGSNTPPNTGNLRVFNINSACSLTEISPTAPLSSGGVSPNFILPTTSGNYVYVANGMGVGNAGNITGFSVATTSGLTMGSSVPAGAQPVGLAQDSTSDWVFEVGSSGSPYFDAYTFDSSTPGKLDSQVTSTQQATSIAIVAAPK